MATGQVSIGASLYKEGHRRKIWSFEVMQGKDVSLQVIEASDTKYILRHTDNLSTPYVEDGWKEETDSFLKPDKPK